MGTHWGSEGQVKVGSSTVAEVEGWTLDTDVSPVEDSAMGDSWETHIPGSGLRKWTGSIKCHWDESDTNGQDVIIEGASVTLNLYPAGSASGEGVFSGLASITGVGYSGEKDGSTVKAEFKFRGNGQLTRGTVS